MRVGILGGYQSDFSRNLRREGSHIDDLFQEAVSATLNAAQINADEIQSIHVGNAFGMLYNGQGHLGAMPASVCDALWGIPAMRHEAACASSSVAVLAAMSEIEAGRYDCVLVLGVEQEKTMPGTEAAQVQHAASWVGREEIEGPFLWPASFDKLADEYDRRYGLDPSHLRELGRINLQNAKRNPNAQTRAWEINGSSCSEDDSQNPVVAGRLRRNDCCQITDGAAGLVLVSERWLSERGLKPMGWISGWGHTTVGLGLSQKLERQSDSPYVLPHLRTAICAAYRRAGIEGPEALHGVEVHDCMTPTEYAAIDHLGITSPGKSHRAIEEEAIQFGGRIPINPSGGLIGGGHPVGATGARMLLDAAKQVSHGAGDYQVPGAKRFATLNIGGSTATVVCFVVDASH